MGKNQNFEAEPPSPLDLLVLKVLHSIPTGEKILTGSVRQGCSQDLLFLRLPQISQIPSLAIFLLCLKIAMNLIDSGSTTVLSTIDSVGFI